jgi:hypothetical protein
VPPRSLDRVILPAMKRNGEPIDWIRIVVHSALGVVFGFVLGFLVSTNYLERISWPVVLGSALALGALGAAFGDRFWEPFLKAFTWLQWW